MTSLRRIWAIYRKDLRDAVRDSRVLLAVVLPLGLGLMYNFLFQGTPTVPTGTLAYAAADATAVPALVKDAIGPAAQVTLVHAAGEADARRLIAEKKADVALIIPPGFDAAVARGAAPTLTVLRSPSATTASAIVLSTLDGVLRQMAGQSPPATIVVDTVPTAQVGIEAINAQLGLRTYFALASVMMMVGMIAMLALPIVLGDEREKKTLEALVLVASYPEVVVAKALLGITYIVVAVPLLLGLTRIAPADGAAFAAAVGLLGATLIGFGLLLGGLLTANQMNTWGSIFLLPIILPPFFLGLPLPGVVQAVFTVLPSTQAMKLLLNSMTPARPFFPDEWLSYLVIAAWGVAAYALVLWRLSRREG